LKKAFDFIDLFAGIGGMRIAFERCGGKCVFSSEWDSKCKEAYFVNFGVVPADDITKIDARTIPRHDILVAGFRRRTALALPQALRIKRKVLSSLTYAAS